MADDTQGKGASSHFFRSEIFKDGPKAASNYSSSIGAEQGLEVFGGEAGGVRRQRPAKTHIEPEREIPVFAETDVLVVGGGPAGTAAAISAAPVYAYVKMASFKFFIEICRICSGSKSSLAFEISWDLLLCSIEFVFAHCSPN